MRGKRHAVGILRLTVGVLAAAIALGPAASGASIESAGAGDGVGGCVQASIGVPPGVGVDSECKPSSAGPSLQPDGVDADATLQETSVTVDWTLTEGLPDLERFTVLRGQTPWGLSPIASLDDTERTYTDGGAAWSGEAIWYQVVALDADGDAIGHSPATLVTVDL